MTAKFREYVIGRFLRNDDVFEQARAILLYQFSIMFFFLFMLPLATDIALGYEKATILHGIDALILLALPFIAHRAPSLDWVMNFFFSVCFITSIFAFMMLNPVKIDVIGVTWATLFLYLSVLMQRGTGRLVYCLLLSWLPIGYVLTNIYLDGALTIQWLVQEGAENPPLALMIIPVLIGTYSIWQHTATIGQAQRTITTQKEVIQEKNKNITDSMRYASGIQKSLLPTEKYIEKTLSRLNKK